MTFFSSGLSLGRDELDADFILTPPHNVGLIFYARGVKHEIIRQLRLFREDEMNLETAFMALTKGITA